MYWVGDQLPPWEGTVFFWGGDLRAHVSLHSRAFCIASNYIVLDNLLGVYLSLCVAESIAGSLVSDGDPATQFAIEKTCGSGYERTFSGSIAGCILM